MPRPLIFPIKKVVGFDKAMLDAIDAWRREQKPVPSVSEAIRLLLAKSLKNRVRKP